MASGVFGDLGILAVAGLREEQDNVTTLDLAMVGQPVLDVQWVRRPVQVQVII